MHKFPSFPKIWILDENPLLSAQYLCDKDVTRNVTNSYKLLMHGYWSLTGIRNKKLYDYINDESSLKGDEIKEKLMSSVFQFYPTNTLPSFNTRPIGIEYKFAKQCLNHFLFIKQHFKAGLDEYVLRFNKEHRLYDHLDWFDAFPPKLPMRKIEKVSYPVRSIKLKYRKNDLISSMRCWYVKKTDPKDYNKRSVPDFFNLNEDFYLQS